MLKFLHDNLKVSCGEYSTSTKRGLIQGSMISPYLFNIYFENILEKIKEETGVEIYAFADDLLFTSNDLNEIKKAINLFEEWCLKEKMLINKAKNKSGIIILQKCHEKNWSKVKDISGILVVDSYKYLGSMISKKGNIIEAVKETKKKSDYIAWRLAPVIWYTSLRFKINMINTFIRPQFSMLAAMSKYINKTEEKLIVTSYRKVIKKVVGLNMRIENVIVDKIAGNILDFNKNTYNRILNKLNERFNLNEQDFYQINYEKINHKLIPNN